MTARCRHTKPTYLSPNAAAADYFEAVAKGRDAKTAANWVINELFGRLNKEGKDIAASPVSEAQLGAILDLMAEGTISGKIAKDVFEIVWTEGGDPRAIVETRGLKQVTDISALEKLVDDIIAKNPDKVGDAKSQSEGDRMVCRPGDEGFGRQSQPAGGQRSVKAADRNLNARALCARALRRCGTIVAQHRKRTRKTPLHAAAERRAWLPKANRSAPIRAISRPSEAGNAPANAPTAQNFFEVVNSLLLASNAPVKVRTHRRAMRAFYRSEIG